VLIHFRHYSLRDAALLQSKYKYGCFCVFISPSVGEKLCVLATICFLCRASWMIHEQEMWEESPCVTCVFNEGRCTYSMSQAWLQRTYNELGYILTSKWTTIPQGCLPLWPEAKEKCHKSRRVRKNVVYPSCFSPWAPWKISSSALLVSAS